MVDRDELLDRLTRLKPTAIRDQLDVLLDEAARRELTLREAVAFLCAREIAHFATVRSRQLRLQRPAVGRSRPDPRSRREPLDRAWRHRAALGGARRRHDPSADRLGREAIRAGYSVLFVAATALVAAFAKAQADGRLEERLAFFAKPKLLIIDELGHLPFEPNAAPA